MSATAPLDAAALDALVKLEAAATPGPWRAVQFAQHESMGEDAGQWWVYFDDSPGFGYRGPPLRADDAALSAALRNAAPGLFAAAREVDELRERLKNALRGAERYAKGANVAEKERDELRVAVESLTFERNRAVMAETSLQAQVTDAVTERNAQTMKLQAAERALRMVFYARAGGLGEKVEDLIAGDIAAMALAVLNPHLVPDDEKRSE